MCSSTLATPTMLNGTKYYSFLHPFSPLLAIFHIWATSHVRLHPMNDAWWSGVHTDLVLVLNWQKNHENWQNLVFKVKDWYILPKSKKSSPDFTYMVLCSVKNLNLQKKFSKCWGHLHFLGVDCLIKLKQVYKIKFFEIFFFLLAVTSVSKKR